MIKQLIGFALKKIGIKKTKPHKTVETSVKTEVNDWADLAYNYLVEYATTHKEFMVEDVREASKGTVPEHQSGRAWGGVVVRASRAGIIRRKEFKNVKNEKAHGTPATLWETI